MSTHASISIQNDDGTVDSINVFYHGYLEGVGEILLDHYNDEGSIRDLIEEGNVKTLHPQLAWTTFLNEPKKKNVDLEDINHQEYNYLFIEGRWVSDHGELADEVKDRKGHT